MSFDNYMQTIKFRQDLLFEVYKNHKERVNELRLWFIARNIIDQEWIWFVEPKSLSKVSKLKLDSVLRISRKSIFFIKTDKNKIYYVSNNVICKNLGLVFLDWRYRVDRLWPNFIKQLQSLRKFKWFILKCFVESQLDKKTRYKISKWRISYNFLSQYFWISRRSAFYLINLSSAKPMPQIIIHKNIVFKEIKELWPWLLDNMNNYINWIKVSDAVWSFLVAKADKDKYYLRQVLPHRYKFTGVSLARARLYRGRKTLYWKINPLLSPKRLLGKKLHPS